MNTKNKIYKAIDSAAPYIQIGIGSYLLAGAARNVSNGHYIGAAIRGTVGAVFVYAGVDVVVDRVLAKVKTEVLKEEAATQAAAEPTADASAATEAVNESAGSRQTIHSVFAEIYDSLPDAPAGFDPLRYAGNTGYYEKMPFAELGDSPTSFRAEDDSGRRMLITKDHHGLWGVTFERYSPTIGGARSDVLIYQWSPTPNTVNNFRLAEDVKSHNVLNAHRPK